MTTPPVDPFGARPPHLTAAQVRSWILADDEDVVVLNKPGWVVCHPSKDGPWSSLVGATRETLGLARAHLVSRLDRETSGLVILARHRAMARRLQMAVAGREVDKRYLAILHGRLAATLEVSQPIGPDPSSPVAIRQCVAPPEDARKAQTTIRPRAWRDAYTLAEITPHTGRQHQIRVHAQWAGHPVVGDKLYGPDPDLYLSFVREGWTERHAAVLPLRRQALHAHRLVFHLPEGERAWEAPLADDLRAFWEQLPGPEEPVEPARGNRRRRRGGPPAP